MHASPRRSSPLLIVIALLAVGLIAWTFWKQTRPGPAPVPAVAPATADAMAISGASAASVAGSAAAQPRGVEDLQRPLRLDPAAAKAKRDQQFALLEQQHRAEARDPAWAGKAESALNTILDDSGIALSGIKPANYANSCRSATCRVSARFKSVGEAEDWANMYVTSTGATFRSAQIQIVPAADGSAEAVIFGARR